MHPDVLPTYAKHYETGEVLPEEFVEKLQASSTFNQGFVTVEFIAAAFLDLAWHLLEEPVEHDARAFENAEMARIGLIEEINDLKREPRLTRSAPIVLKLPVRMAIHL